MSYYIRVALAAATVLVLGLVPAGCASEGPTASAATGGREGGTPAVPVAVASVIRKSMPLEIAVIGTAEPFSTVAIRSQITGQLVSASFTEGDEVRQGQVLFELDRRPFEAALQAAEANLQRDLAQAENAAMQAKRYEDLAKRGIATREQLDTSRTDMSARNAVVTADRAAVESARVQLDYATIRAPIAGRTGALMVHEGNLVRANDTTPLVTINQVMPISVSFAVPEARLPELKRYMDQGTLRVTAAPPNDSAPPAVGRIAFIDNAVNGETGTIRVKGTFANSDRRLWPGQFVNVVVTLSTDPEAIVVPSVAVQEGQEGPYVFVVTPEETVEMRAVALRRQSGAETVIASGVTPGETVVTDGHLRLVPGGRISIKPATAAAGQPPAAGQRETP